MPIPFYFHFTYGEMAEWSNAAVLKTVVPKGTGGSNPSLSATFKVFFGNKVKSKIEVTERVCGTHYGTPTA